MKHLNKKKEEEKEKKTNETVADEEIKEDAAETEATQEKQETEEPQVDPLAEMKDKYLRLVAEYDNYKKRTQREKEAIYTNATADAVAQILQIIDNLTRAAQTEAKGEEAQKIVEGVQMVVKQSDDILSKMGVEPIETVGKTFDPNLHNAVMHIEDDQYGHGEIIEEFIKGYTYKGKVIRHSMVKVAN